MALASAIVGVSPSCRLASTCPASCQPTVTAIDARSSAWLPMYGPVLVEHACQTSFWAGECPQQIGPAEVAVRQRVAGRIDLLYLIQLGFRPLPAPTRHEREQNASDLFERSAAMNADQRGGQPPGWRRRRPAREAVLEARPSRPRHEAAVRHRRTVRARSARRQGAVAQPGIGQAARRLPRRIARPESLRAVQRSAGCAGGRFWDGRRRRDSSSRGKR